MHTPEPAPQVGRFFLQFAFPSVPGLPRQCFSFAICIPVRPGFACQIFCLQFIFPAVPGHDHQIFGCSLHSQMSQDMPCDRNSLVVHAAGESANGGAPDSPSPAQSPEFLCIGPVGRMRTHRPTWPPPRPSVVTQTTIRTHAHSSPK